MAAKKKVLEQFFTPETVAEGMLDILRPRKGNLIDPACGDGVFLKLAGRRFSGVRLYGCDVDNQCLLNAQRAVFDAHFLHGDALNILENFEGKFDYAAGNPPFSAQRKLVKNSALLQRFTMGKGRSRQAMEILFLELFIRLLKPGGRFSMVLPENICAMRPLGYVRAWLADNIHVESIISLPRYIFDGTAAKCVILTGARKKASREKTFFAVCRRLEDMPYIAHRINDGSAFSLPSRRLTGLQDWRPEFVIEKPAVPASGSSASPWRPLGELAVMRTGYARYGKARYFMARNGRRSWQVLGAKNFIPWAGLDWDRIKNFIDERNPSFSARALLKEGEILLVRVGMGCIGRVAVFENGRPAQADDWLHVLTPRPGVNPWYLAAWLASTPGRNQIKNLAHGVGTMSISKASLRQLGVPMLSGKTQNEAARFFKKKTEGGARTEEWAAELDDYFKEAIRTTEASFFPRAVSP
jgi:type I restriction enzyme M protein